MKFIHKKAPAKLNLFLRVLRRRPDDYHDIFSLFHKIDLSDDLVFQRIGQESCQILSNDSRMPTGRNNLIAKVFKLLKEEMSFSGGVRVRVKKRIPLAGGLGGGSSNAAQTFLALDRMFQLRLKKDELKSLAMRIGADIPFFLEGSPNALVSGIGEKVRPYSKVGSFHFLLIFFPKGLATGNVYRALALTPHRQGVRIPRFVSSVKSLEQLKRCVNNDLMAASFELYPFLRKVYQFILQQDFLVSQSGSGPTLFVADASRVRLKNLKMNLKKCFGLTAVLTKSY